jgi:uncharacterized protein GlcG (DUF336 family)
MTDSVFLTLAEARAMIARGVEKATELRQRGAIVVVDAGGNVVSTARMDDAPVASIAVSRAKAYAAAVQGRPTAAFATNARERPEIFAAFQTILPKRLFPGPGGMPIVKNGRVVGGIATGGGIGPYTLIPGVDPAQLMVDGVQANAEDLVICAALGIPYASQHGERALADSRSLGVDPTDPLPLGLAQAWRYADRVMEEAVKAKVQVGVAVVDQMGRVIQSDRMDGSALVSAEMAEAKALSAAKFQRPTAALTEEFKSHSARMRAIERLGSFTILAMGGGVPIVKDGVMVGAIGVSGSGAQGKAGGDEPLALAAIAES